MKYNPGIPPMKGGLREYLYRELLDISRAGRTVAFEKLHVAPDKPQEGQIEYADGTNWNPGAGGEGLYVYLSTGWTKL